jgi:uncharacterized damage-inducible protein DinB
MSRMELRPFGVATAHTAAVIRAVPSEESQFWDLRPSPNIQTMREQLAHIALLRESVICTLTNRDPEALKTVFEAEPWSGGGGTTELLQAWDLHTRRCQIMLADLHTADLGRFFQTEFGNVSTPENYLRLMLLEETHHRAQMILMLRLFELDPPEFPGRAWAELNM